MDSIGCLPRPPNPPLTRISPLGSAAQRSLLTKETDALSGRYDAPCRSRWKAPQRRTALNPAHGAVGMPGELTEVPYSPHDDSARASRGSTWPETGRLHDVPRNGGL